MSPSESANNPNYRAGSVALIGKPNVGKSTLMNLIVGQKVSIVSNKPQTTRRRILGISTTEEHQIAFLDTPGIHEPHTTLDRAMIGSARSSLDGVDVVVIVGEGGHHPGDLDKGVAKLVSPDGASKTPVIVCINKMDQMKAENVIPFVEAYCKLYGAEEYMLTTATTGRNVDKLVDMIVAHLPVQPPLYPADEVTDASSRFLAGEFVREKILTSTREEVPYATAVVVDEWTEQPNGILSINATIIVDKSSQRGILIGKQGAFLKKIGEAARKEIEELLGRHIFLGLHVRVQEGWRMDPAILHELEYSE